ncbi:enoyl-CoA hydratase/isomerase family protein [Noviherbaspirillum sedimenti]|uniref:Enoyl-CoA hydratase/isomerase family protein n=1 Tax=Noviherbaspirillum sedimenti TaxID=2320865 RepID=A0A3A3G6B2_9BURK|nr:enoyl-CoA hydratase-related protein [Noviherbaspirillum sedimenti]RJG04073.1 enoyl-CoA hydratase/isomerase family protein [Noviherbaspirillum sedimenti]
MPEIRLERSDAVATVTLSNPGKLNAVSVAMWEALAEVFARLSQDEQLRCVIVRGDQGNFAAGADIEEFPQMRSTMAQGMHYHRDTIARALDAIAGCLHPTIAAIEGVCIGGGLEIACACDLRIAAPQARFGIPVNRLGFALAPDELRHFLQLVGRATALEILLEGRVFGAAEAREKGLLHRIVDDVPAEAQNSAERIARGAPLAARMHKQLVRRLTAQPQAMREQEYAEAFAILDTQDYREGVQSFLHKTRPVFIGK